jgi:hypothetical protein
MSMYQTSGLTIPTDSVVVTCRLWLVLPLESPWGVFTFKENILKVHFDAP